MSRVGKKPIILPTGVNITVSDSKVLVSGPKGKLERIIPSEITLKVEGNRVVVKRNGETKRERSLHGLIRTLLSNAVTGVVDGFQKRLLIYGVGYNAQVVGRKCSLSLGYSHPLIFELPNGVSIETEVPKRTSASDVQCIITVSGIDKEAVGQVAATLRSFRPPEPYKGKGIRYEGEYVRRKAGKAAATTGTGKV